MTDTRDSFEKIIAEMQEIYKESLWMYQLHHRIEKWADRLTALQSGAGDGDRMDFLESLAVADIDEKAITRLVIFNLWRGTTYDDLRTAIDNAQATEGK